MALTIPGTGPTQLVQKIELRISCMNLPNRDLTSLSDPCAVFYVKHKDKYKEYDRTEQAKNTLDPKFSKPITIDYFFEMVQYVRVRIYDLDNSSKKVDDDDFLGQIECTLGQIVTKSPFTKIMLRKHGKEIPNCTISINAFEIKEGDDLLMFQFSAKKLSNKDLLSKSDPFLEISQPVSDGSWQIAHRTEVIKNNLNPEWRPFTLRMKSICNGDMTRPIRFTVFDFDKNGSHDLIGSFESTLSEIIKAKDHAVSWPCVNESKRGKKKGYTDSGTVVLNTLKIYREHTFLDYIFGGLQINLTIGVDFTASNGFPHMRGSLHFLDPEYPNEYMKAIRSVGTVLQDYDWDKMFPALGFGAVVPPSDDVSFEFPLNLNPQNPYCAGIDGVIDAYLSCIRQVQLRGPTNVAPIIKHVARFAEDSQAKETERDGATMYFILLLLTDGDLTDMDDVKNEIVRASSLPMSIIIVGIGQADFRLMEKLDGDDGVLKSTKGVPTERDIVQFVPMRNFQNSGGAELSNHVLAEIPKQVTSYFNKRHLPPRHMQAPM
ncbi:copine-3-like [Physella acuta]|uniref:copine-3-like n=1 Tax=Physella acuta TaxID=109671 RepID=UPI0027DC6F80|nr:copine-3-like [Physella acuta]